MAENTCKFEVAANRMESCIKTRQHLDARHLKTFIEEEVLESMTEPKQLEEFCDMIESYKKRNFQEESVVLRILKLKAEKKLAEMQGMSGTEYTTEISRLEEIYAGEEDTKIKNIIDKIKC